ncbi:glycosyltransferase family 2 protein [Aureimonas flava]|nr:glycosyltransferase family 2 protein [Aureimonas flava]
MTLLPRRFLPRLAKVIFWTLTFQMPERYRAWKAARSIGPSAYESWVAQYDTLDADDRRAIREDIAAFSARPTFSIVMPTYNSDLELLELAIRSVRNQLYPDWELCIADDASPNGDVPELLRKLAAEEPRIKWQVRAVNGNISRSSNTALELATGDFVVLMDHDDVLSEHALYMVAREIVHDPELRIVYSDEDQIDRSGRRHTPYFKPDWNLDLLLGHNVISHLGVYRRDLVLEIGGFRTGLEGSQDHDLALRAVAAAPRGTIRHIPTVLYHWRRIDGESFSQRQLERCRVAGKRAVEDHLKGLLGPAPTPRVVTNPLNPDCLRTLWPLPSPRPSVSVVIPTRDRADLLATCVRGLRERTDYDDFEIVIVDNESREPETHELFAQLRQAANVRIMEIPGPFNYSRLNNLAVAECSSEIIVLLNNDIDVIGADWLSELVSLAIRPDVGAVGAKLLYANDEVQHAGVIMGIGQFNEDGGIAGHAGMSANRNDNGYFGQYILTREMSAVTGACLAMRRETFDSVGGLNEIDLPVAFNDVDLCLRIRERGLKVLWTPFAQLYHYESQSRGDDFSPEKAARFRRECEYMVRNWRTQIRNDPFYNGNFSRENGNFRLRDSDAMTKPWRHRPSRDVARVA